MVEIYLAYLSYSSNRDIVIFHIHIFLINTVSHNLWSIMHTIIVMQFRFET